MAKNLLLIVLAGMLLGCSCKTGHKYDITAIDRIEVGQTPESDVITMLGMPLSAKKLSNGINIYGYAYGKRCPLGLGNSINSLEVQFYNGVVINKWQAIMHN